MNKTLYTVNEIAEILGLHPKTVQRFIREGKLKANKIGRAWKIHVDALKEFSHAELAVVDDGPGPYPARSDSPVDERVSVSRGD